MMFVSHAQTFLRVMLGLALGQAAAAKNPGQNGNEELTVLRAAIAHHDELYFKKAAPEISDYEYDLLKRRLATLEAATAREEGDEEQSIIGDDRTGGFARAPHREPMLSLEKSHTEAEVRSFVRKISAQSPGMTVTFIIEPKFDGLAISVLYEKGKLIRAVTRGNGFEGDDVTANLLACSALPASLRTADGVANVPERVELRGEVYMTWAEFKRINAERAIDGDEPFAHPRNLAAGTLKQTGELREPRRLEVVFYGVGACEPESSRPHSQSEWYARLRAWGLPVIGKFSLATDDTGVWRAVEALGREQPRLPFPIDGAVIKINDFARQSMLGAGRQAPRWALAHKFAPLRVSTELRAITLQIGRTGVLTPVAELAPVRVGGASVARASLHNRARIERRDYRVGDVVYVEKAGEIIPELTGVDLSRRKPGARPFIFPENCPACATKLVADGGADGALRCPEASCPPQVSRRVAHFASKNAVAITGLGPVMAQKLVEAGLVKNVADLYALKRSDLIPLSGVGEKTAERLLASIQVSRRADLWRIVHGLGIPRVGPAAAHELAEKAQSLSALAAMSADDLRARGISERVAKEVAAYFQVEENRLIVRALK